MNKSLKLLALTLLFGLFAQVAQAADQAEDGQISYQAPGFVIENIDGTVFRYPQDLKGPTIILFWASWCPYCKALMPHLQSVLDEFPGQVEVLAPNFREDADPAELLAEYGYDFHLLPEAEAVAEAWGVKATPGLFLADKNGRIVFDILRIPPARFNPASAETSDDMKLESMKPKSMKPKSMKHYQKAARRAPIWAAELRIALDKLLDQNKQ